MKRPNRLMKWLLTSLLLLAILACQTALPQPTATPNPTATLTATIPPPTSTATPLSEADRWERQCTSVTELGRIGAGSVNQITFSKDQKRIAIAAGSGLGVYNSESSQQEWFNATKSPILQAVFIKADTELLAISKDYRLATFDARTGEMLTATDGVDVMNARLNEDGSLVMLADWLGVTHVYDTADFKQVASTETYIKEHETVTLFISDLVYVSIQFSPDSKLITTAAANGRITFFNTANGTLVAEYPLEERALPQHVTFSGDSKYVAIDYLGEDDTQQINILSITGGFLKQSFQGTDPALSHDGKYLASQDPVNDKIMIWEVFTGKLLHELASPGHLAGGLKFSADSQALFSGATEGLNRWSVVDGTLAAQMPNDFSNYRQVAIAGNGKWIALRSDYYIEVRDFQTGELLQEISTGALVRYVAFDPESTKLAGLVEDKLVTWDPVGGSVLSELTLTADFFAFTPDPKELITAENYGAVSMLELKDGKVLSKDKQASLEAEIFAVSSDGALIATGSYDTGITLTKTKGWNFVKRMKQPGKFFEALALSPSGTVLAVATGDQKIKIWNAGGDLLCTLSDQQEAIRSMAFSSDGNLLFLAVSDDGYIFILGTKPPVVPGES